MAPGSSRFNPHTWWLWWRVQVILGPNPHGVCEQGAPEPGRRGGRGSVGTPVSFGGSSICTTWAKTHSPFTMSENTTFDPPPTSLSGPSQPLPPGGSLLVPVGAGWGVWRGDGGSCASHPRALHHPGSMSSAPTPDASYHAIGAHVCTLYKEHRHDPSPAIAPDRAEGESNELSCGEIKHGSHSLGR